MRVHGWRGLRVLPRVLPAGSGSIWQGLPPAGLFRSRPSFCGLRAEENSPSASPAKLIHYYSWVLPQVLGICLSFFFAGSVWAEPTQNFTGRKAAAAQEIATPLDAPRVGERLVYDVFWMGIPVGMGTLEVKEKTAIDDRPVFHLEATARTNAFLSRLYPVEDEIHSFVDAGGFYSIEFRKTLKEGRYRADERVRYDYAAQKGYYESFWNKSKKEIPLECGYAQDILAVFYWFRLQKAELGKSIRTVVNSEEKNWDLELRVLSRQTKEVRDRGVFDTILVEPKTRLKGILYQRGRALVYFTTDERRLPVWITLKTPFGPVVGVLRAGGD